MIHLCVIWRIGAAGQYPRGGREPWRTPQSSCAWDCLGFSTEVLQPRKHLSLRQTGMARQPTLLFPESHHTMVIMSLAPTSSMVLCTVWMKLWKMTWFPNLWMTQNCKKLLIEYDSNQDKRCLKRLAHRQRPGVLSFTPCYPLHQEAGGETKWFASFQI